MEGKVCGVTSEGETAKCKKVVCDPSYLPNKVNTSCFHIVKGLFGHYGAKYLYFDRRKANLRQLCGFSTSTG